MTGISAVIITYNEEDSIERCIRSVMNIADEIVVVDSFSTDNTIEICKKLGATVYMQKFLGYREQKNWAMAKASNRWILSLDGDEAISQELEMSLIEVKKDLTCDGYIFNRLNNYCGTWIRHSNWYPDRKLRLFNREKGEWGGINPHDKVVMHPGTKVKHLKGDLLHWVISSYEEHVEKANRFSSIAAKEYFQLGRNANSISTTLHMIWRFLKAYIMRGGFRDGYNGFVISSLSAYSSFLKYLKLRQLNLEAGKRTRKNRDLDIKPAGE